MVRGNQRALSPCGHFLIGAAAPVFLLAVVLTVPRALPRATQLAFHFPTPRLF
jgi:hypothetical protein